MLSLSVENPDFDDDDEKNFFRKDGTSDENSENRPPLAFPAFATRYGESTGKEAPKVYIRTSMLLIISRLV